MPKTRSLRRATRSWAGRQDDEQVVAALALHQRIDVVDGAEIVRSMPEKSEVMAMVSVERPISMRSGSASADVAGPASVVTGALGATVVWARTAAGKARHAAIAKAGQTILTTRRMLRAG